MRKIVLLLSLLFAGVAGAQQVVNCAPAVPCTPSGPENTGTGDAPFLAFGKTNANFLALPSALYSGGQLPVTSGGTGVATITGPIKGNGTSAFSLASASDIYGLWTSCTGSSTFLRSDGVCATPSGAGNMSNVGTPVNLQIGQWTSTTTMQGLSTTGSGSAVLATSPTIATPILTSPTLNSTVTLGSVTGLTQCLNVNSTGIVSGTGAACGAGGGGSGTVNSAAAGTVAYYASTGTAVSGATLGGNLLLNAGALVTSQGISPQTGTTYALVAGNAGNLVTASNAASQAYSLSAATTTGFTAGYSFDLQGINEGLVTLTPATSTINGQALLSVGRNQGCTVTSDGTNYQVSACNAYMGPIFTLGTGTGACATTSTLTGQRTVGSLKCTGTAGASTQPIILPQAPNGWSCYASDVTSGVGWSQSATSATGCTIKGTLTTTSDVVVFSAIGY